MNETLALPISAPEAKETMAELRTRMNLSRREVADLAGVTQSQVWRMEHNYPVFTAAQASVATDDIAILWVKIWDALVSYEGTNPDGKPKAAKKITAAYRDVKAHTQDLEELKGAADIAISILKTKKVSSVAVQALATRIDEMLAELTK